MSLYCDFHPIQPVRSLEKSQKATYIGEKAYRLPMRLCGRKSILIKKKKNLYIKDTSRIQGRGGYFKDITGIN